MTDGQHRAVLNLLALAASAGEGDTLDLPHIVLQFDPQTNHIQFFGPCAGPAEAARYIEERRASDLKADPDFADLVYTAFPMRSPTL